MSYADAVSRVRCREPKQDIDRNPGPLRKSLGGEVPGRENVPSRFLCG